MDINKRNLFDKINILVNAYNEANQYDRNQSYEVVNNELNMTYEGRCVYLLRQIFNSLVEASGQKINDGIILSLIDSSTLIRRNPCSLTFDFEKQQLSYTVPDKPNRKFSLKLDESNKVIFKQFDRRGSITCFLQNGNSICGRTKSNDISYDFAIQLQENGLLEEYFYKRMLYEQPSGYLPSFFGDMKDISIEHHVKLDGERISCQDYINVGGQSVQQDFNQYGIISAYELIRPLIPGFAKLTASDHNASIDDDTLVDAFPELNDIANQYYNNIRTSQVQKK